MSPVRDIAIDYVSKSHYGPDGISGHMLKRLQQASVHQSPKFNYLIFQSQQECFLTSGKSPHAVVPIPKSADKHNLDQFLYYRF